MTSEEQRFADYVDVAERIRLFYERYPEGSLKTGTPPQVMVFGERQYVVYHALAYRSADDDFPAEGWAWEPIPGPTPFTRDSELMNAETAAWGRAIIAAGIPSKKIASADEVQARQSLPEGEVSAGVSAPSSAPPRVESVTGEPPSESDGPTDKQYAMLGALIAQGDDSVTLPSPYDGDEPYEDWTAYVKAWVRREFGKRSRTQLTKAEMSKVLDHMKTEALAPF